MSKLITFWDYLNGIEKSKLNSNGIRLILVFHFAFLADTVIPRVTYISDYNQRL